MPHRPSVLNGGMRHGWGIASTGNIAAAFARSLTHVPDAELVAVGSRSEGSASRFAGEHAVPAAHGSIADLAADPHVEIVYVAGVNTVHAAHAVLLAEAGKHVLVEKPVAMNTAEFDVMVAAARSNGVFLMEAMWMRFNPLHVELVRRISSGEFGPVEHIESDFSFNRPLDPSHRLFDPSLGGGSLLDVGIYPLTLAWWLLGEPDSVESCVETGVTGVDTSVSLGLGWNGGATAHLTCGSTFDGPRTSVIRCTGARIEIPAPSHAASSAHIGFPDGATDTLSAAPASLHHQVPEVHRCVEAGLSESPRMPHGESRAVLAMMEQVLHGR